MTSATPPLTMTPSMPGLEAKRQILLSAIHGKWGRLSDADLSAITSRDELIARVRAKYRRTKARVQYEVDTLLGGRKM